MSEQSEPKKHDVDPDGEVDAIKKVLTALTPLSDQGRQSVLDYVVKRLGVRDPRPPHTAARPPENVQEPIRNPTPGGAGHIKELRTAKQPRSDSEMAALAAYWLRDLAPDGERRDYITRKDVEQLFKIAEHPLPKRAEFTLPNAKGAGYVEQLGEGKYKLNAVGYNLVAHTLPREGAGANGAARKRGKRKAPPKKKKKKSRG